MSGFPGGASARRLGRLQLFQIAGCKWPRPPTPSCQWRGRSREPGRALAGRTAGSLFRVGVQERPSRRPPRAWGRRARMHGFALGPRTGCSPHPGTQERRRAFGGLAGPGDRAIASPWKPRVGGLPACADPGDDEFLGEDAQGCRSQSECGPRNLLLTYIHIYILDFHPPFSCVV